jgi:hypothetical protein
MQGPTHTHAAVTRPGQVRLWSKQQLHPQPHLASLVRVSKARLVGVVCAGCRRWR